MKKTQHQDSIAGMNPRAGHGSGIAWQVTGNRTGKTCSSKQCKGGLNFWQTLKLRLFSIIKIPMLGYVRPVVKRVDDAGAHVVIPLSYRTKNHVASMYFGALSVGADLCIGLVGIYHINQTQKKLNLVFKDFKINFFKKAYQDVHFVCEEGDKVKKLVDKSVKTAKRQNGRIHGHAFVLKNAAKDIVAEFDLTLSIK
ncbi:MAG: DUF4442 domain-containing protein [Deltaproteobacteria bacterium]|nr:DUF4442 domain-containing protein [Deltaproteobacteria bacterium]